MGFFNTLITKGICFHCKHEIMLKIQFRFGENWMHNYCLGDRIIWGKNNYGKPNLKKIIVNGISEDCPICKRDYEYYIFIEQNIIKNVKENHNEYDFSETNCEYITLEK